MLPDAITLDEEWTGTGPIERTAPPRSEEPYFVPAQGSCWRLRVVTCDPEAVPASGAPSVRGHCLSAPLPPACISQMP